MYGLNWEGDEVTESNSRFKVGDRIKVVVDGWGKTFPVGAFGTIKSVLGHGITAAREGGDGFGWFFRFNQFAPAFRTGDRVKLNMHSGIRACGERGTVTLVRNSAVGVNMDEKSLLGTLLEWLPVDVLDWERAEEGEQHTTSARVPWQGEAADCAGRKERQDNEPKPKFKAGDVVQSKKWKTQETIAAVRKMDARGVAFKRIAYEYVDGGWDFEDCLELATSPAIVALTKNGQPLPSYRPHVHASVADATQEAERLARVNPGQEFAVYQRVTARVAEVQMKEVA